MKKILFLLLLFGCAMPAFAQKQPYNFPVKSPDDSDFIPTQIKTGSNYFGRRINLTDAKQYFLDLPTALDGDGNGSATDKIDQLITEMVGVRLDTVYLVSGTTLRLVLANGQQFNITLPGGAGVTDGDKGDITVTSAGSIWTVDNDAITAAKIATAAVGTDEVANGTLQNGDMATMPNNTFKGNASGAPAAPSDLTALQVKNALAITTADLSDFVEAVEDKIGSKVIAGANVTVTYNDSTGETTVAASGGGGDPSMGGDLGGTASNAQLVGNVVGTAEIAPGAVGTSDVADAAITYAKMQNASANTVIARAAGTSGALAEISISNNQLVGRGVSGNNLGAISLGLGLSMTGNTLKHTAKDSLYAVANTLYLRGSDGSVTSVTITVSFPRDTMWLVGNDLKFAPEGNTSLVQTLTLPAPVQTPVTTTTGTSIVQNLTTANVHILDATSINAPTISTTGNQAGKWYEFHVKNNNDSIYLSPSKFSFVRSDGSICPLKWITTPNFILTGYADASIVNIATSSCSLPCYPFKAPYQAVIDRAKALGLTLPSPAVQIAQNALVDSLMANGIWDSIQVLYVVTGDAATKEFTKLNWKNPTGSDNLTEIGTCTYAAAGWSGDGSTSALNTNWTPSTEGGVFRLNSCSFGAYIENSGATANKINMGAQGSGGDTRMEEISAGKRARINGPAEFSSTGGTTTGLWHINRSGPTTTNTYLNGTSVASGTASSTTITALPLYLMALNLTGTVFGPTVSTVKYKVFFAGGQLSGKASKLSTLINAYVSSI